MGCLFRPLFGVVVVVVVDDVVGDVVVDVVVVVVVVVDAVCVDVVVVVVIVGGDDNVVVVVVVVVDDDVADVIVVHKPSLRSLMIITVTNKMSFLFKVYTFKPTSDPSRGTEQDVRMRPNRRRRTWSGSGVISICKN